MSPHCDDEKKYGVVDKVVADFKAMQAKGETIAGHAIIDLITVNGVRVVADPADRGRRPAGQGGCGVGGGGDAVGLVLRTQSQ